MPEIALPRLRGRVRLGLSLQRFADGSKVGRFIRRVEGPFLPKPFNSDPGHEAGERGESALLGMRRHPGQLENLVGHRLIDLGRGDRRPAGFGRVGEPAAQRFEPSVHVKVNRNTPTLPSPASGGGRRIPLFPARGGGLARTRLTAHYPG